MTNLKPAPPVLFIFYFFTCLSPALSQAPYSLKTYKMTIDGTSSLHDWTSDVTKLEFSGQFITESGKLKDVKNVTVKVPVGSIKSTKGKIMDNKTWEAFSYDKHPHITYKLLTIVLSDGMLKASGTLTMAGVSQAVVMDVQYTMLQPGEIRLTGSHRINMKDFKMEPPTAMMGTIKVGEAVTVKFDLTVTLTK